MATNNQIASKECFPAGTQTQGRSFGVASLTLDAVGLYRCCEERFAIEALDAIWEQKTDMDLDRVLIDHQLGPDALSLDTWLGFLAAPEEELELTRQGLEQCSLVAEEYANNEGV